MAPCGVIDRRRMPVCEHIDKALELCENKEIIDGMTGIIPVPRVSIRIQRQIKRTKYLMVPAQL